MAKITLREITGDEIDSETIVSWRNDPDTARCFPPQEPWTVMGQQRWYRDVYRHDPSLNLYFVRLGYDTGAQQLIGTVGMRIKNGAGEMMWMMLGDKSLARNGYMRQGMRMLMEAYGLAYYWGRVMPDNVAGLRFQERNGFTIGKPGKDGMVLIALNFDGTWPEDT